MNPFVGLRPFTAKDSDFYNGRELVTSVVETKIRLSPFTVMFARSGVGKSSFIICRLIEKLKETSYVQYINEWGQSNPEDIVKKRLEELRLNEIEKEKEDYPVLILDQFEDVFKEASNRSNLWNLFAEINNELEKKVNILISMREEWLGAWNGEVLDYLPSSLNSMLRLSPLTDREILSAINKPIKKEGSILVSSNFADAIMRDLKYPSAYGLADEFVEPGILQLVCFRMWEEASKIGQVLTIDLYNKLGGSDSIIKDHVWRRLGSVGEDNDQTPFSVSDRIFWVGLTKRLVAAHGVKASVTVGSICSRLKIDDFGIAGVAFVKATSKKSRKYLESKPEKRNSPPEELIKSIQDVFDKGVSVGFLKKQKSVSSTLDYNSILYEYSHDSLSDVFTIFAIEFESWIQKKLAILTSLVISVFILLPVATAVFPFLKENFSWEEIFLALVSIIFGTAVYLGFGWIILKIGTWIIEIISHPILRWLAKGRVPTIVTKNNMKDN